MRTRVGLSAAEWTEALERFPAASRDIFFTPTFHHLHVANHEGDACCTIVDDGADALLIPGIRCPILPTEGTAFSGPYWDIQSCASGYAGPLATPGADRAFLDAAWTAWRKEMAERGIVSVFFRLHPLIENWRWLPSWARVRADRSTVYVDLLEGDDARWRRADGRHRNMVSKARRQGVVVDWQDPRGWADFESLYTAAMNRLGAPERLRYSHDFFAAVSTLHWAELACVRVDGGLAAASVFLFGDRWAHYQFSARQPSCGNHLSNFILQGAVNRAVSRGLEGLYLGGGRSPAPDDALLVFKRSVGGRLLDYRVAILVTEEAVFNGLISEWTQAVGHAPDWLTGYRQPWSHPVLTEDDV